MRFARISRPRRQVVKAMKMAIAISVTDQSPWGMTHLRRKLEEDPARPHILLNEPGVGYRMRVDE